MQYLSLKIFKDSKLVKTKIFTDDQISLGSSEGLSLKLDGLSPWHALIEKKHDIFCVLDLNSDTGTFIAGKKITDETPLNSGDTIQMGPYEIQFFVGPPVETGNAEPAEKPQEASPVPKEELAEKPQEASPVPKAEPVEKPQASPVPKAEPAEKPQAPPAPSAEPAKKPQPSIPSLDSSEPLKPFVPPADKPSKKGFWNTYAPLSRVKNLDDYLEPSIGNLIEVSLCWKERILKTYYFFKNGDIFMGGGKNCQIQFPNMLSKEAYKLLTVSTGAQIYLSGTVTGALFQGRDKATRTSHALKGNQSVTLKPYEMVRLDFNSNLKLYIRLMDKPAPPPFAGLLNLRVSEALALFFALLLTAILFFFGTLYAPSFLIEDIEFKEKEIKAQVIFNKKPEKRKIVKYDLTDKTVKAPVIKRTKRRQPIKKPAIKAPIKKPVKKITTPKKGKPGKIAAVARGKKPPKKPKIKIGSARPGGSLKTGKAGSSAKTVAPDPTKVGILGVFGKGGKLAELDKGASGPGGLTGLAQEFTGAGGTERAYEGKGLGTETKELSSGGKGSAIQGISGIKTGGKGLGSAGTGRGGLGERGRMSMEFSTEDVDVVGQIDREAILRVIRRNQAKFERCYQMGLNETASIQGNLSMKWIIAKNGRGQNARSVRSDIGSDTLKNCVAGVLERLTFPEPPSGQIPEVQFTFRFYL